jgi:hypothetical protein
MVSNALVRLSSDPTFTLVLETLRCRDMSCECNTACLVVAEEREVALYCINACSDFLPGRAYSSGVNFAAIRSDLFST